MIDTKIPLEKFLQYLRFRRVRNYLKGDILDFGGNEGELKKFVGATSSYTVVNYDHSEMKEKEFDTIVSLAVIEHIEVESVYEIFGKFKKCLRKEGRIFLTTPTPASKPILEFLAWVGLLDKQNIEEHKHYWDRSDIFRLAEKSGFEVLKYRKFQLGFNQWALLKHQQKSIRK